MPQRRKFLLVFALISTATIWPVLSIVARRTNVFGQAASPREEAPAKNGFEEETLSPAAPKTFDYGKLNFENGDIIFRRGISLESRAIIALDGADGFSHVGIIRKKDSQTEVIHASFGEEGQTDEIVICEPIERFLKPSSSSKAAVYRFNGPDGAVPASALKEAESFVEKKIPFDKDYDLDNADKIYCTELVWRAYLNAGIDLTGGKFDRIPYSYSEPDKKFILPGSLVNNSLFVKVWESN